MNRYQLICSVLVTTAVLMGGLIAADLAGVSFPFESEADAAVVLTKGGMTVLSTRVSNNEQFVYVLDNRNERLLAYRYDPQRKIELYGSIDVGEVIRQGIDAAAGGRGGGRMDR